MDRYLCFKQRVQIFSRTRVPRGRKRRAEIPRPVEILVALESELGGTRGERFRPSVR